MLEGAGWDDGHRRHRRLTTVGGGGGHVGRHRWGVGVVIAIAV